MDESAPLAGQIVDLLPSLAVNLRLSPLFESAGTGLTPSQILCTLLIDQSDGRRITAGQLARRLCMSAPSATAMVDRLVKAGLLVRDRGKDRRVVWISLTERGGMAVERLRHGVAERVSLVLDAMDAASRKSLLDALLQVASFADQVADQITGDSSSALPHGSPA